MQLIILCIASCPLQELGALMLKAGKAAEAAKHLQQALEIKVTTVGIAVMVWLVCLAILPAHIGTGACGVHCVGLSK
jgi:hypothetical protein